jgi:hypothetical protein
MKARRCFVSNSSSSSFVFIGNNGDCSRRVKALVEDGILILGTQGENEFGWGPETISDVFSMINFAKLQVINGSNPHWGVMLDDVIKEATGCTEIIWDEKLTDEGYIDHQSSSSDGSNTEIFADEDTLRRFLFCTDSEIVLDNDNH